MDLCQPHFLRSLFSAAVKIDIGFSKLIPKHLDISGHKSPEPVPNIFATASFTAKEPASLEADPSLAGFPSP